MASEHQAQPLILIFYRIMITNIFHKDCKYFRDKFTDLFPINRHET